MMIKRAKFQVFLTIQEVSLHIIKPPDPNIDPVKASRHSTIRKSLDDPAAAFK
jgi:hypothetical protein